MPDLKDFHVDENKMWFNSGYWPEGVPHQIYEIEGIKVLPLFDNYVDFANENNT